MSNLTRIILSDSTVLTDAAREFINQARMEADLGELDNVNLFSRHKTTYLRYKYSFLSKGNYTFTFKTATDVTDVSETEDKLGWKYVYRVTDTKPILGIHQVKFSGVLVRGSQSGFLTQEEVEQREQGNYRPATQRDDDTLWHFDILNDLIRSNNKIDTDSITIKVDVEDRDLPIEVVDVLVYGMARIIALSGVSRLDLARELARALRVAIVQAEKYREKKRDEAAKSSQERFIDDIIRLTGGG